MYFVLDKKGNKATLSFRPDVTWPLFPILLALKAQIIDSTALGK
uniref:Uncharacterized protein n=1 Tax=Anguilla anguilla TaxID=7936 RepID=A0A0E9WDJ5_ANGAN